jgi:hypothetical protein
VRKREYFSRVCEGNRSLSGGVERCEDVDEGGDKPKMSSFILTTTLLEVQIAMFEVTYGMRKHNPATRRDHAI